MDTDHIHVHLVMAYERSLGWDLPVSSTESLLPPSFRLAVKMTTPHLKGQIYERLANCGMVGVTGDSMLP